MENFNKVALSFHQNKVNILEGQFDRLKAYVYQKYDKSSKTIDELVSRVNNLR